ncbi:hypothetical protein I4U23_028165 [Adineta vaga]|nr:hypothetical protein I4U23_028165 [Adineta vaga]
MSAFDGNRDGFVDGREINDAREFGAGDVNRDGALNRAEFSRVDNPREFNQYDTNRDGLVDTPEFARGEAVEHQYGL